MIGRFISYILIGSQGSGFCRGAVTGTRLSQFKSNLVKGIVKQVRLPVCQNYNSSFFL